MQVEWRTALVEDGTLTVEVTEDAPKGWGKRVTAVLERLGHADRVKVKKQTIVVAGVEPGKEADVRHLLDSTVLQAAADLAPDEETSEQSDADPRDQEMTEAFRGDDA